MQRQYIGLSDTARAESTPQSSVLASLGCAKRIANGSLPQWTSLLNGIATDLGDTFGSRMQSGFSGLDTCGGKLNTPFEHLYWPIAKFAWTRVCASHPAICCRLDKKARSGLQAALVRRLSSVLSAALHPAFLAHCSLATSSMMRHFFDAETPDPSIQSTDKLYKSFVAEQSEDGLTSLFKDFPVAARLTAESVQMWVDFIGEFFGRLLSDESEIACQLNGGAALGKMTEARANLSDPHHGGRSVLLLTFQSGLRIVYKPRPMDVDQRFYEIVESINATEADLNLGVLSILTRPTHGWMEFVQHGPCPSLQAAGRYFQRAGALACLTHWLGGIDLHRENVIAAGEQPALLDLECLAHPTRVEELPETEDRGGLAGSLLRTGLLPMWQFGVGGVGRYDNCGFGAPVTQRSLLASKRWKQVNTDRMFWVSRRWRYRYSAHRAHLRGRLLPLGSFEPQICRGYRRMAEILNGRNASRYASARDLMYEAVSRRIKRPTFLYAAVLRRSLQLSCLTNGVDRSIELMALPHAQGDEEDWLAEVASMEKLDIPYFQFPARSKSKPRQKPPVGRQLEDELQMLSASVQWRVRYEAQRVVVVPAKLKASKAG